MREAERGVIEPGMEGKVEEVVAGLRSYARRGLSTEEARSRLERYGPNNRPWRPA
jgi:Cation transporter/ATPase, N-terminus